MPLHNDQCSESFEGQLLRLWGSLESRLYGVARAFGFEASACEDILQETYLAALRKAPRTIDDQGLQRWIYRVASNQCRQAYRKKSRADSFLQSVSKLWRTGSSGPNPESNASMDEDRQHVRNALDDLKPEQRFVLVLRYYCTFSLREISEILEIPESTVRSHARIARQRLARSLHKFGLDNSEGER